MKINNDQILEIFKRRFACKGYDPTRRVSDEDFETLMEVARLSPSSFGFEPWKFILIENEDIKRELYPYAWGLRVSIEGASHLVAILAMKDRKVRYDSDYIKYILDDIQGFPGDLREARWSILEI